MRSVKLFIVAPPQSTRRSELLLSFTRSTFCVLAPASCNDLSYSPQWFSTATSIAASQSGNSPSFDLNRCWRVHDKYLCSTDKKHFEEYHVYYQKCNSCPHDLAHCGTLIVEREASKLFPWRCNVCAQNEFMDKTGRYKTEGERLDHGQSNLNHTKTHNTDAFTLCLRCNRLFAVVMLPIKLAIVITFNDDCDRQGG